MRASWDRGAWMLLACYPVAMVLLFRPAIHGVDAVGYFSWLRTIVIDRDLNVADEFEHFATAEPRTAAFAQQVHRSIVTPTGYQHNQYALGAAVLWLPIYVVAHAAVSTAAAVNIDVHADGYGRPYQFAAALASSLYGLAAMLLTYRLARRWFTPFVATWSTFGVWFASPLVFYGFSHPLMSHATDAFVFALILTAWCADGGRPTMRAGLLLGIAIGLATWVRTQNAAFVLAPLLVAATDVATAAPDHRADTTRRVVEWTLAILLGFALLFAPLAVFWRVVFGHWIVNTYAATHTSSIFDWRAPHMLEVLLSSNRGMFVWSPITALALAGLWWLRTFDRRLALFLAIVFVEQLYIIGSLHFWHGSAAFGPRYWTNLTPLFVLGFAALLTRLGRVPRWAPVTAVAMLVTWNLLLIIQYALQTVPRGGPVDVAAMAKNQFLVVPAHAARVFKALIER